MLLSVSLKYSNTESATCTINLFLEKGSIIGFLLYILYLHSPPSAAKHAPVIFSSIFMHSFDLFTSTKIPNYFNSFTLCSPVSRSNSAVSLFHSLPKHINCEFVPMKTKSF